MQVPRNGRGNIRISMYSLNFNSIVQVTFPHHFVILGLSVTAVIASPSFVSFGVEGAGREAGLRRGGGCREEGATIQASVCRITWEEECSVARRTVGQRVVMQTECNDREVMDCKTVQMVYQEFPRFALHELYFLNVILIKCFLLVLE